MYFIDRGHLLFTLSNVLIYNKILYKVDINNLCIETNQTRSHLTMF